MLYLLLLFSEKYNDMNNLLKNESVKWGLYLGVAMIVLGLLPINIPALQEGSMKYIVSILSFIVYIYMAVTGAIAKRKALGGYWSYGMAVTNFTLIFSIGLILSSLFNFVYFNYIDHEAAIKLKEQMIESQISVGEKFNLTGTKEFEAQLAEMEQREPGMSVSELLIAVVLMPIGSLLIALIAAIFLKKERPLFES